MIKVIARDDVSVITIKSKNYKFVSTLSQILFLVLSFLVWNWEQFSVVLSFLNIFHFTYTDIYFQFHQSAFFKRVKYKMTVTRKHWILEGVWHWQYVRNIYLIFGWVVAQISFYKKRLKVNKNSRSGSIVGWLQLMYRFWL